MPLKKSGKKQSQNKGRSKYNTTLEDSPSLEDTDPSKSLIFLYGDPKVGKSHFFSNFNDVYFIATEKGLGRLNVRKSHIKDWTHFKKILDRMQRGFESGSFNCGYIVVDTVDILFQHCMNYICELNNVDHPSDMKWGKGWEALGREWIKNISILVQLGPGVGFVGHATEREVIHKGLKHDKTVPSMQKTGFKTISALCDYIVYATIERVGKGKGSYENRFLYLRGTPEVLSGCRDESAPQKIEFTYEQFLAYCKGELTAESTKKKIKLKGVLKSKSKKRAK